MLRLILFLGFLVFVATACAEAPVYAVPEENGQEVVAEATPVPIPSATPWPTEIPRLDEEGNQIFFACYVRGINDQWVIFKPHWVYGERVFAIRRHELAEARLVVQTTDAVGQWPTLAADAPYVAVAVMSGGNAGRVEVYDLEKPALLGIYETGYAPVIEEFNSQVLRFVAYDGSDGLPQWRSINPADWRERFEPSGQFEEGPPLIVADEVQAMLENQVPWCQEWPPMVTE